MPEKKLQGKGLECDWVMGGNLGMVVREDFLEEVSLSETEF